MKSEVSVCMALIYYEKFTGVNCSTIFLARKDLTFAGVCWQTTSFPATPNSIQPITPCNCNDGLRRAPTHIVSFITNQRQRHENASGWFPGFPILVCYLCQNAKSGWGDALRSSNTSANSTKQATFLSFVRTLRWAASASRTSPCP